MAGQPFEREPGVPSGDEGESGRLVDRVVGSADKVWLGHMIFDRPGVIDPEDFSNTSVSRLDTRVRGGSSLAMQDARSLYADDGVPTEGHFSITPIHPLPDVRNEGMLLLSGGKSLSDILRGLAEERYMWLGSDGAPGPMTEEGVAEFRRRMQPIADKTPPPTID